MCLAVPDVQQVRDGLTVVIDSIKDLEEMMITQSPQHTVPYLHGIIEQLQQIQALLAVEAASNRDRVTIQKFT